MAKQITDFNNVPESFSAGLLCDAYRYFGNRTTGNTTEFLVWAPNADCGFLKYRERLVPMERRGGAFYVSVSEPVDEYRYVFEKDGVLYEKNDPYAFSVSKNRMSRCCGIEGIGVKNLGVSYDYMNIYELHVGSWMKNGSFSEIAHPLAKYVSDAGYNFVELMPVNYHPCNESWGYQTVGYFAFQYGTPAEFAEFVRIMHTYGIGVIADWVPGHFACDSFGLPQFDGTPLYESEDAELSQNRLWGTVNTDFSKPEVCSFMLSSACFFADVFGVDGIRVDAVSNMLIKGFEGYRTRLCEGDINSHAIAFLRTLTSELRKRGVITIAEDTACGIPATGPVGLGFDRVWNMGWFHDTLVFLSAPPEVRSALGGYLLKPLEYMNNEKYILPISHDENVHGKKTVFGKIPSDGGRSYRLLLTLMAAFPGDKLHFAGTELAARSEWDGKSPSKKNKLSGGMLRFVSRLNRLCAEFKPLKNGIFEPDRFDNGVLTFIRKNPDDEDDFLIFVFNFSNIGYDKYYIGIDRFADYEELVVTSEEREPKIYLPEGFEINSRNFRTEVNLPPLCGLVLRPVFNWKKS